MKPKQKRTLSVDQKYEIIRLDKSGVTQEYLAEKYHVEQPTICRIVSESNKITTRLETRGLTDSQSSVYIKWLHRRDLEKVIYHWCMRCQGKGITLTKLLIRNKALEFNKILCNDPDFRPSGKWVTNFMRRFTISERNIYHFRTADQTEANKFKSRCKEFLLSQGFSLENVYNVDYTELIWRAVPEETSMFRGEPSVANSKMYKDHVTVLLCVNATGCHKLPALVVAKFGDSQDSEHANINCLSITYEENSNALMDSYLFNKWFEKCFLKSVIDRQSEKGCREQIMLLVDNARWDFDLHEAENKDEFVFVAPFPDDVTLFVQPMDCGIIKSFKRMYRKELVETIMPLDVHSTLGEALVNHKGLLMWDCCRMIRDAWSNVEDGILKSAWGNLLMMKNAFISREKEIKKMDTKEIVSLLHKLPGGVWCDTDVMEWYEIDNEKNMLIRACNDEVLRDYKNFGLE